MTSTFLSSTAYSTVTFDIGDVLCTYSLSPGSSSVNIQSSMLEKLLSSAVWDECEKGLVSESECYKNASTTFLFQTEDLRIVLGEARKSLVFTPEMTSLLRELKFRGFRLYAMSNISHPDFQYLSSQFDFSIFEHVYTSFSVHMRKPDLGFYRYVLEDIGGEPEKMIFIDDKHENVLSAKSFGIHGIQFQTPHLLRTALWNLLGDPAKRARSYLEENAAHHYSVTSTGITFMDNFSQLLIYELTGNRKISTLVEHQYTWNFFQGPGILTSATYPDDLDTTSLALTIIERAKDIVSAVINDMLNCVSPDGIISTYFDDTRVHFDPVVYRVLQTRVYLNGTRYYACGELFLFFLMRFLQRAADPRLEAMFVPVLTERICELVGSKGDALAHAIRILVCDYVGIYNHRDFSELVQLQCEDGSWEQGWLYKYGKSKILIGNRGLTTALAMRAVEVIQKK
ncbi:hypothetical protein GYMLUDRAFT_74732 [Collybiopsis luxurians FD-317 M1]|uniref:HAD-like protein n=1 Tax=Collybiopsis luxurians FD-317 M1 TaxID=944289 RepID=A0A0D0CKG8_9AGAR|nr:hypothetical protein GYMLUDRAFT_74732 [Collybiopsis luxurians FD-317 M1]